MKTCDKPDRDVPKIKCGYPLPCPHHTVGEIDLVERTVKVKPDVPAKTVERLIEIGKALAPFVIEFRNGSFFQNEQADRGGKLETAQRFDSEAEATAFIRARFWMSVAGAMPMALSEALRRISCP